MLAHVLVVLNCTSPFQTLRHLCMANVPDLIDDDRVLAAIMQQGWGGANIDRAVAVEEAFEAAHIFEGGTA